MRGEAFERGQSAAGRMARLENVAFLSAHGVFCKSESVQRDEA